MTNLKYITLIMKYKYQCIKMKEPILVRVRVGVSKWVKWANPIQNPNGFTVNGSWVNSNHLINELD